MKKTFRRLLPMMLIALGLCMVSCVEDENDRERPGTTNPGNTGNGGNEGQTFSFVGVYDITIITDSLSVDGTWFSNEYYSQMTGKTENPKYGRLEIEKTDVEGKYSILSVVKIGNDSITYYNTTATLQEDGSLQVDPNSYERNDYTFNFTFSNIIESSPLVFRSELHVPMWGMDCGYIMTNTAVKRTSK